MTRTIPAAPMTPAAPTAPTLPAVGAPLLPAPALAAPISSPAVPTASAELPGAGSTPTLPAAVPRTAPNWKPIQRSKARKALNGLIGICVLAALAGGAWFAYQSLAPAEDTTTPTTLLIDNPDTFVGQANTVVEQINEQAPDQEILDLVGVESPDAPATPDAPTTPTTTP